MRTLVVTNDFPPRVGGIQAYVHELASRQPPGEIVVYAPRWPGDLAYDRALGFPVVRHRGSLMLPEPSVRRRAVEILRAEGCDRVWFGAAAPLALLARPLRRAGAELVLGSTHGHEPGWGQLPVARSLLRRIAADVDVLTYISGYTGHRLAAVLGARRARLVQLPPGVDTSAFSPAADGAAARRRYGLGDRPVVVCVSRLVPRKGQDMLLRVLPELRRRHPGTVLLLVGSGPDAGRLHRLAERLGVSGAVTWAGAVPAADLPGCYAAGDVFAMPCRTRRFGLDVEGLGIVFLEASATGVPVVAGRSGGAPDAVRDGDTGSVVDGRSPAEVLTAISALLGDLARARELGARGRAWVQGEWQWDRLATRLRGLLMGEA